MESIDIVRFVDNNYHLEVFSNFQKIRASGKLCDVTLAVDDQEFSAHKIVLAATIPFFNGMFMHDMLECSKNYIPMQGIEASALEQLILFAYTGEIQISSNTVQTLLIGANFLQMTNVMEECCKFLLKRINAETALSLRHFGQSFLCHALVEGTDKFINHNFDDILSSRDFLMLHLDEVTELLDRDELVVSGEEQIFDGAMRWIKHDLEDRSFHVEMILKHIRLPVLSPTFLSDYVATEDLIRNNLKCRDLLDDARDFYLIPDRRCKFRSPWCFPRGSKGHVTGCIYVVGGMSHRDDLPSIVERYDPIRDQWTVMDYASTHRSRVGVAVLQGKLYAMGGFDGSNRLRTVEVFDPSTKKWENVAPMNCQRSALGATAVGERLFVCGGYDGTMSLRSCEVYCPQTNRWVIIASMNDSRSAGGVVAVGGVLYALGGHNGLAIYDSVEALTIPDALQDPGKWTSRAPMRTRRCRHGVCSLNGQIYVAGGYNGIKFLQSVELYCPETNQWTDISPMLVPRSRIALAASFGRLFAIGGYDGAVNLNTMECYLPQKKAWFNLAPLHVHEGGVGVGVIPFDFLSDIGAPSSSCFSYGQSSSRTKSSVI